MEKTIVIMRGLPSSGKTSFADMLVSLCDNACMFAADDFFKNRPYNSRQLGIAHKRCIANVEEAMQDEVSLIVVHNTSITWKMYKPYVKLALAYGYRYFIPSLFDGGCTDEELHARNRNGVPLDYIQSRRQRFQHEWGQHARKLKA